MKVFNIIDNYTDAGQDAIDDIENCIEQVVNGLWKQYRKKIRKSDFKKMLVDIRPLTMLLK